MKHLTLLFGFFFAVQSTSLAQSASDNVVLISLDGLRWQELFSGADSVLIGHPDYVHNPEWLKQRFWREDVFERRELLFPFFWGVIANEGQLYGNRTLGCKVTVTNGGWFSYPGYSEILTGYVDPSIDSNDKIPNPNTTVLEYVNRLAGFEGRVAAFGSWDVFPYIINEPRSGVPVNAGFESAVGENLSDRETFLNELQRQIPSPWGSVRLDAFTHHYALEHARKQHPRLLYIAYGETDDFAHDGEYEAYLKSARQTDAFIEEVWVFLQNDKFYRGRTTLIITTDHGRGTEPIDTWRGHGTDVVGSNAIWLAALGPHTSARGEVDDSCNLFQNQVAATVGRLLGIDFNPDHPVGDPVMSILEE